MFVGRKHKIKPENTKQPIYKKTSCKYVVCMMCHTEDVKISSETDEGICWRCCQSKIEPPTQLIKKEYAKKKTRKQRGWQFMKVYVDQEGTVYHCGVEQPKLKGTLHPTPKKEYKRKTIQEKIAEEEKQQQKLVKRFERAQREKDKKNGVIHKKRGRPQKYYL